MQCRVGDQKIVCIDKLMRILFWRFKQSELGAIKTKDEYRTNPEFFCFR